MEIKKFEEILSECSLEQFGLEYRKARKTKIKDIIDITIFILYLVLVFGSSICFLLFLRPYLYLNLVVVGLLLLWFTKGIYNTKLEKRIISFFLNRVTAKSVYLYIYKKIPYEYIGLAIKYQNTTDPFLVAYPEYWKTIDSYRKSHKRNVEQLRSSAFQEFKEYENKFYIPYLKLIKSIEVFLNTYNLPYISGEELYIPKLKKQYCDEY